MKNALAITVWDWARNESVEARPQDAIQFVAKQANISEYEVRAVPEPKNLIEQIMESAGGGKDNPKRLDTDTTKFSLKGASLVELAAPHFQHLDPQRVRAVKNALRQLQILQQEGVSLVMPETLIP